MNNKNFLNTIIAASLAVVAISYFGITFHAVHGMEIIVPVLTALVAGTTFLASFGVLWFRHWRCIRQNK